MSLEHDTMFIYTASIEYAGTCQISCGS